MEIWESDSVSRAVRRALLSVKNVDLDDAEPAEDVFLRRGFDSLEKVRVLARIETDCDVFIGDDVADFDRMRTLSGLLELVREKVAANGQFLEKGSAA